MAPIVIPPPPTTPDSPDKYTRKGDFTGEHADDRVLRINLWFFKYGTDDKPHAAAIALSLIILFVLIAVMVIGLFSSQSAWLNKIFDWLGATFIFVAGVAIGRTGSNTKQHD